MSKENYYGIIYSVTNQTNNKKYIGQTTNFEKRKYEHLNTFKQNKTPFQKALNKYGIDNFIWDIIDYANSFEELDIKEIYWIDYYDTYGRNGYNATIGGQGCNRPITKEKRIEYLSDKKDNHPFVVFDKQGNFIEECDNRLLWCIKNDIPTNSSRIVLRNKKPSVHDFILIYKKDFTEQNLKQRLKRIRYNREFVVFDDQYNYLGTWSNQLKCERDLGFKRGCINKVLTGVVSRINGHYFYYLDNCPIDIKQNIVYKKK